MLLGTGTKQEGWIVASALIAATERLKFLLAIRPSIMSPTLSARMAATFDQISNGRLLLNIVPGGSTQQLKGDGVFLDHDQRYEATDEFLHIWRSLFYGEAAKPKVRTPASLPRRSRSSPTKILNANASLKRASVGR